VTATPAARAVAILCVSLAQSMPSATSISSFRSPKVLERLELDWDVPPDPAPVELPDGSTAPATAPWPFVLVVSSEDGRSAGKIEANVFGDARVALATRAVKLVKVRPADAVSLPYLSKVPRILDPTLIAVSRDFEVAGVLRQRSEFTADKLLSLMSKAAGGAYETPLAAYVARRLAILSELEKLWSEELAIEDKTRRIGDRAGARESAYSEIEERERALAEKEREILSREEEATNLLSARPFDSEALPERVGTGRSARDLTPGEKEAISVWRRFSRDRNPLVRAAAIEDLGAVDSEAIVAEVLRGANDSDPRVVRAAGRALARMASPAALAAIAEALPAANGRAARAILYAMALARRDAGDGLPHVLARLAGGDDELRRAAIEALAVQASPAAVPPLVAALSDRVDAIRVLAAGALGELRAKEAVPALVRTLSDPDWSLEKAAAEALAKIRAKESIEPLVARFETAEGLLLEVIHAALVAIVGKDFGFEPSNWREFWTRSGATFRVPTDEEIAEARRRAERGLEGYAKPGKHKYHKIETLSRKMIFVIDVSASMADKIVIPPDAPPSAAEEFPDRVKMEIARKELIDLLASLEDYVQFDIITFAGRVDAWKGSLVSAANRNAAIKYVSELQPMRPSTRGPGSDEQKTNTYGALVAAFGLADERVTDWKRRSKVDTIFFVTDGDPTTGDIVDPRKIVEAITELNASRGIVIHLVCFDKMAGERLRGLAEKNGGKYVLRGF